MVDRALVASHRANSAGRLAHWIEGIADTMPRPTTMAMASAPAAGAPVDPDSSVRIGSQNEATSKNVTDRPCFGRRWWLQLD
eukprot:CAMPEP_0185550020 /NCGR_PEP_ID=MMETSP1381-20130426/19605_1 /TAXON_ID=298111 /ORGANISM="Pavlova sp., Strain CCMP459" /LENGTH=81 /DNA_ID=CAMNT_0028162785 /DNA_START=215 /DNA_END=458 /DNA_ORIENTATION=-